MPPPPRRPELDPPPVGALARAFTEKAPAAGVKSNVTLATSPDPSAPIEHVNAPALGEQVPGLLAIVVLAAA